MSGPGCSKTKSGKRRKHTRIVSKAQQGMMGAELGRRRTGKALALPSMTTAELESHLHESAGKKLPERRGGNMQRKSYDKLRREGTRGYG